MDIDDETTRRLLAPVVLAFLREELHEAELEYKYSLEEGSTPGALGDIDGEIAAYTLAIDAIAKRYKQD